MKPLVLSVAILTAIAAKGMAQPLVCPVPADVFAAADKADPHPINLTALADAIGSVTNAATAPENVDLGGLVASVRQDYPKASNAEIADLLVTGYCTFLQNSTTASEDPAKSFQDFETYADTAVFHAPPEAPAKDKGWLYQSD